MPKFKISITNGKYFAPSMIVEVSSSPQEEKKAIELAKEKSGLGSFENWNFSIDKKLKNESRRNNKST